MDEEEELDNTLIGQEEEAPAVNTGDALMGSGGTTPRMVTMADANNPAFGSTSAPATPARPITMADANNPALEGMSASEIIGAVNTPGYQSPDFSIQTIRDEPRSKGNRAIDPLISAGAKVADLYTSPFNVLGAPQAVGRAATALLFGTEDNLDPTLGEAIDEGRGVSISELVNPNVDEMASRQDQLAEEFLSREPRPLPPEVTGGDPNRPPITGPFSGPVDPFAPPALGS